LTSSVTFSQENYTKNLGEFVPNLLITGFEPFDGFSINPSAELAKQLDGEIINRYHLSGFVLPLDYTKAFDIMKSHIEKINPSVILCCGQVNRSYISLERIALNAISTTRADNYDNYPPTDTINHEAPAAYFSNIDLQPLAKILSEEGIPAAVSYHAGTYGCNWIFFKVMHYIQSKNMDTLATFIHVPPLPTQAIEKEEMTVATMPLDIMVKAVVTMINNL